ncbi:MAG: CHASE2 domain-containing protein [Opitutae bacterium]|nr:CHASE2 domain-containing protein [Opitutae bacterium]
MKIKPETLKIFFALAPIPFIWAALAHFGALDRLKNALLDLRFKFRGEVEMTGQAITPLGKDENGNDRIPKVVYADFDQRALSSPEAGERPWDRKFFAKVAEILLDDEVGAKAVGYDFIFSNKSMSKMVPEENIFDSENKIGKLVAKYPDKIVLGANYTAVSFEFQEERISSAVPLLYQDGYKDELAKNYPEAPTYPMLFYKDGKEQGRLGILAAEMERSKGSIPRWAPLHFPYAGDAHAKKQLVGLQFAHPIEKKKKDTEARYQAAAQEVEQLRNDVGLLDRKIEELKAGITNMQKAKPVTEYLSLLEKLADAQKVVAEKDAAVKQLLVAIQANPATAPALQKGVQTNIAAKAAAEKNVADLKAKVAAPLTKKLKEAQEALQRLEAAAKANPAAAAAFKQGIDTNKKVVEETGEVLSTINAELDNAKLLTSVGALSAKAKQADSSLKQLEAAAKANPAAAAAFKQGIDTNKAAKEAAEKKLAEVKKKIVQIEKIAGFEERLAERNKVFKADADEWQTNFTEATEALAAMQAQSETATEFLLGAEKDFDAARIRKDSIQSDGFDRSGITFEKQEKESVWLLKTKGGEVLHEIPATREEDSYYHFAVSMILAAYGLDGSNVEITNERIVIKTASGESIVDAKLEDRQLLEINWFSKWREDLPDIMAREALGKHRDNKDADRFFAAAEKALEGALKRAIGKDVEESLDIIQGLAKLNLTKDVEANAKSLVEKIHLHDGSEKLDDWYETVMAVLGELAKDSIPPFITSRYNPRCSIIDIFNYGDFLRSYRENLAKHDARIKDINDQVLANPELKADAAGPLKEYNNARSLFIEEQRGDFEKAKKFLSHFKDAIVLVGPVDPTFQDLAPTPFDNSPVPKVGVHGNLIKTLLAGKYIKQLSSKAEMAGIFGLGFLMIFIGFYNGPMSTFARPVGILLQIIYVAVAFWLFKNSHLVLPIVGPVGSALTTTFVGLAIKLIIEEKAKGRITGMFGSYVSSDLVEQMVESGEEPSLGGEEQKITAYFSDVQAFSAFSELLSPTGLVDLMNEYLTAMTDILQEERGTLDKYIGDAIVAMYGAPIPMHDHAYQGVKTAVLMQKRQLELREKWKSEGDKWPDIVGKMQTRIGLNTGTATVGNMGSTDRFNYTMMGDMVNLAARSESGAKAYGAYIMITEDTKRTAEEQGKGIAYRYLDKIVVKGRTQPVEMYEVTDFWDDLSQDSKDCLDLFQQGIDSYLKQDWNKSLDLFERAKELEPNKPGVTPGVKDNPSMILIDRVKSMKDNPPGEDWDGVYVMTSK